MFPIINDITRMVMSQCQESLYFQVYCGPVKMDQWAQLHISATHFDFYIWSVYFL